MSLLTLYARLSYFRAMPRKHEPGATDLLAPREAAAIAGVTPRTIHRYGSAGRIEFLTLPSGHRRYVRGSVEALVHQPAALAS